MIFWHSHANTATKQKIIWSVVYQKYSEVSSNISAISRYFYEGFRVSKKSTKRKNTSLPPLVTVIRPMWGGHLDFYTKNHEKIHFFKFLQSLTPLQWCKVMWFESIFNTCRTFLTLWEWNSVKEDFEGTKGSFAHTGLIVYRGHLAFWRHQKGKKIDFFHFFQSLTPIQRCQIKLFQSVLKTSRALLLSIERSYAKVDFEGSWGSFVHRVSQVYRGHLAFWGYQKGNKSNFFSLFFPFIKV